MGLEPLEQAGHFGALLVPPSGYRRFTYTPHRLVVARTLATVLSVQVKRQDGEELELLVVRPVAANTFAPSSTVAKMHIRQTVVMHAGDRLLVQLDPSSSVSAAQVCMIGDGFEQQP